MSKNIKKNRKFKVNKTFFQSKVFWFIVLFILLIILILIDTFTKIYVRDKFKYVENFSNVDSLYRKYTHNKGFAFSAGEKMQFKYQVIIYVILFLIIFCYFIFSFKKIKLESFGWIFILSGVSNFINKLWHNKCVIDFIPVKLLNKLTVANVADIFVIIGVSFILLQLFIDLIFYFIRRNAKKN